MEHSVGTIVTSPKKPEWGLGKILAITGTSAMVYFQDYPEEKPGDAVRKMVLRPGSLRAAENQSNPWLDALPPYREGKPLFSTRRITMDQAIAKFLKKYPSGFSDEGYIGDLKSGERACKMQAHEMFSESLGGRKAGELLAEGDAQEVVKRVKHVVNTVNLLYPSERTTYGEALKDEEGAEAYVRALFAYLDAPEPREGLFDLYAESIRRLPMKEGGTNPMKWTILTVVPFIAQPDRQMFLKPEVSKQAGQRLHFGLQYKALPNWRTYSQLLKMSHLLLEQLKHLGAQDLIDVQSFIWLTGDK